MGRVISQSPVPIMGGVRRSGVSPREIIPVLLLADRPHSLEGLSKVPDDSSIMRGSATGWWRDGKKQRIGFGGVTGDFGQTFQGMWAVGQKQYGDYLARAYSSTAYSAHYWDGRLANYPDPEVRYLGMEEGQKKDKQPGAGGLKGKCKEVT